MKRLMLLCGLVALLAVPAASADTSDAGYTVNGQSYYTTWVTSSGGFDASAAFTSRSSRDYYFEVGTGSPGDPLACSASAFVARGDSATLSCHVASAGTYRLTFYLLKGPSQAVTVATVGPTAH